MTSVVYKKYDGKDDQQKQQYEKIASTDSSGLVTKLEIVVLEFFFSKKWIQKVLEVKPFSNRLMMIQLQMNKRTVVVYSFSLCTSTRPL